MLAVIAKFPLMAAVPPTGGGGAMVEIPPAPTVWRLRIVVLRVDFDVWCDTCGALCATTTRYLLEGPDGVPEGLHLLTDCDACEMRDVP